LEQHIDAVIRILVGFLKAYVLAEWVKPYIITAGAIPQTSAVEVLIGVYAFNVYLYLNFAGYCDVMIGAGTLFGIQPPENFDKPFLARNISDFWQRQHRSLTLWLTDYIFTPTYKRILEVSTLKSHALWAANLSLILTMAVSGLWHGASYGFLVFGLIHGFYLVVYRSWDFLLTKQYGKKRIREWRERWWVHGLGIAITFNAVSFAFVSFQYGVREGLQIFARLLRL
jgi:D-alanyl-lipoteichoic acid acyltransferase DltB (MBOAT superfamily)